ncbi:hypothetical protein [Streptomyces sp. NPDC003015]
MSAIRAQARCGCLVVEHGTGGDGVACRDGIASAESVQLADVLAGIGNPDARGPANTAANMAG